MLGEIAGLGAAGVAWSLHAESAQHIAAVTTNAAIVDERRGIEILRWGFPLEVQNPFRS
jgi:hypothetical protein